MRKRLKSGDRVRVLPGARCFECFDNAEGIARYRALYTPGAWYVAVGNTLWLVHRRHLEKID